MGASNAAPHVSAAGRVNIWGNSDKISLILEPTNTGAGGSGFSGSVGPNISIGHNTNASLPASGHIAIKNKEGNTYFIWVDGNGNLRFGTNSPNSANDFSGAVIS